MEYPVIDLAATGMRIKELRNQRHLKVAELADILGLSSVQAVYKWESESSPIHLLFFSS